MILCCMGNMSEFYIKYVLNIQRPKTAVVKAICGLKKITQKFFIVQNVIPTIFDFAKLQQT